jgi:KDO2-lipid IV(A) lauroyltransferase
LGFDVASTLLRALPLEVASGLGGILFGWFGPLSPWDRTVRRNLELAFPERTIADRRLIRKAHWAQFGRLAFEFPLLDRLSLASGRIDLVGRERLQAMAGGGRPTVIISGHFSNFEVMAAAVVGAGVSCVVSYWPCENPYFDKRIIQCRRRYGLTSLARNGFRGARRMTRALTEGVVVGLLIDQRLEGGLLTPFFGHMAESHPGAARMALAAGAVLMPIDVERLKGARFRVTVHAPLTLPDTGRRQADIEAGVRLLNGFIEERIRERPHEWFWSHKRWPEAMYAANRIPG